jgi:uncharacterized protein YcbX
MAIEINQLFIYPVKSLRGIAVSSAELTATGFKWDRHWMITKPDGGFLTQRQFPKMVLIQPQLTADSIILSKTGMNDLIIPFKNTGESGSTDTITDAKVWKDSCKVVDEGEAASAWITQAITGVRKVGLSYWARQHIPYLQMPHPS